MPCPLRGLTGEVDVFLLQVCGWSTRQGFLSQLPTLDSSATESSRCTLFLPRRLLYQALSGKAKDTLLCNVNVLYYLLSLHDSMTSAKVLAG
mmetsp:Transcript_16184/g.44253  ORF Transcript_16184/g.44253 Transcript_16184/m.44253 type:complete len:92 (-) Transcript_16184:254-529(-)